MRTYLVRKGIEEEEADETQKNTAESQHQKWISFGRILNNGVGGDLHGESGSLRLRCDPEATASVIQNTTLHLKINTSQLKESQIPI